MLENTVLNNEPFELEENLFESSLLSLLISICFVKKKTFFPLNPSCINTLSKYYRRQSSFQRNKFHLELSFVQKV